MEIDYSTETKGQVYAYRFSDDEKSVIAKAFEAESKRIDKAILKIQNNPKNDGQVHFGFQIDELRIEREGYVKIAQHFSNGELLRGEETQKRYLLRF